MSEINPPAVNPCGSCPYRRDVPSGVWSEEEYEKLPRYDPGGDQILGNEIAGVFMCHQQDGRMCAGWCAVHNLEESIGFRIAVMHGQIREEDFDAILDYQTSVPLFASGTEAAAHGRAKVLHPDHDARRVIDKLTERRRNGRER